MQPIKRIKRMTFKSTNAFKCKSKSKENKTSQIKRRQHEFEALWVIKELLARLHSDAVTKSFDSVNNQHCSQTKNISFKQIFSIYQNNEKFPELLMIQINYKTTFNK